MLAEYDGCVGLFSEFGPKAESLVKDILAAHSLRAHTVTHRIKERLSMERKLSRPDKQYSALGDVTDLLGVRVITYFPDEVDTFAEVLLPEFDVVETVDRRQADDPSQFGYASLHCVVRLNSGRRTHLEYRRFADCVLELQIRSILQHAWAEIEHDLGYKTSRTGNRAAPRDLRRRFSRLSGLLELADDEFRAIRDASKEHVRRIEQAVTATPNETPVDRDSIVSFVRTSKTLDELDSALAEALAVPVAEHDDDYAASLAHLVVAAGLHTIGEIEASLEAHVEPLRRFSSAWLAEAEEDGLGHGEIPRGISLFHLLYLIAWEAGEDQMLAYVRSTATSNPDDWAAEVSEALTRILTS